MKDLIVIFPRCQTKRADKNYPKEKWTELINWLKWKYPLYKIVLTGTHNATWFADGVPEGTYDGINIPPEWKNLFDIQIAAMERAVLVMGSISGPLRVAMFQQCRTLEWGPPEEVWNCRYRPNNPWTPRDNQRYVFWPEMQPSVDKLKELISLMMENQYDKIVYPEVESKPESPLDSYKLRGLIQRGARELMTRPFLWFIRRKNLPEGEVKNWWLMQ